MTTSDTTTATVTFPFTLEVTVHSDSFATNYGLDFDDTLSRELADKAGNDAIIATETEPDNPLALLGVTVLPTRGARHVGTVGVFGGEFTTATVHLTGTAEHDRFAGAYGADPKDVVPQFIAARLLDTALLDQNRGTVTIVTKGNRVES